MDFLIQVPDEQRSSLMTELLQVEFEQSQISGHDPTLQEYLDRFPDYESSVEIAWDRYVANIRVKPKSISRDGKQNLNFSINLDAEGAIQGASAAEQLPTPLTTECEVVERFGQYHLIRKLGQGAMGVVYLAEHATLNRKVALKLISSNGLIGDDDSRFLAEVKAAAVLDHPGIASVYEYGAYQGQRYYAMRFLEGRNLAERLREETRISPKRIAQWAKEIAEAIDYAHSRGVIHRDLKPSNILISIDDHPCIVDFGLAKRISSDDNLTCTGQVVGTPAYMAPEQASGQAKHVGPTADVFSIGVILFEMLTGKRPFVADSLLDTLLLVRNSEVTSLRSVDRKIPRDLETICLKCLEKEPSNRFQSAGELALELDRYLTKRPIQARRISGLQKTIRWCHRNPIAAVLICVLCIATSLLSLMYGFAVRESDRALQSFQRQIKTINDLATTISEADLAGIPNSEELRIQLLSKAEEYYKEAIDSIESHPGLADLEAQVHARYGSVLSRVAQDSNDKTIARNQLKLGETLLRRLESNPGYPSELTLNNAIMAYSASESEKKLWQDRAERLPNAKMISAIRQEALSNNLREQMKLVDPDEQIALAEEVIRIRSKIHDANKGDMEFARKLANAHHNLAEVLRLCGNKVENLSKARQSEDEAQAIRNPLLLLADANPALRIDWAKSEYTSAIILMDLAKESPADYGNDETKNLIIDHCREALTVFERADPASKDYAENRCNKGLVFRLRAEAKTGIGSPSTDEFRLAIDDYFSSAQDLGEIYSLHPKVNDYAKQFLVSLTQYALKAKELAGKTKVDDDLQKAALAYEYSIRHAADVVERNQLLNDESIQEFVNSAQRWFADNPNAEVSADIREWLKGLPVEQVKLE